MMALVVTSKNGKIGALGDWYPKASRDFTLNGT